MNAPVPFEVTATSVPVASPAIPAKLSNATVPARRLAPAAGGVKLDSLLVCQDAQMVGALRRALGQFDVESTVAGTRDKAEESILNAKFDAIIVDLRTDDFGADVLRAVRNTRLNRRTMVIAIADDYRKHQQAFQSGANFTIPRVTTLDQATRCLRSSYYMMVRQRRSSIRFPIDVPVVLRKGDRNIEAKLVNISETGVGMQTSGNVGAGEVFSMVFDLPGTGKPVKINAKIIWVNGNGIAGAAFQPLEDATLQNLQDWINGNLMGRFEFSGLK